MDRDILEEQSHNTIHCGLCHILPNQDIHYKDTDFIVITCRTCNIPMIVYRYHTMTLPIDAMLDIHRIIGVLFGPNACLRLNQRSIKHHWHAHILTKESI